MKRSAVVTGASSGIGLAIATRLLNEGFAVANWDIRAPEPGSKVKFVECDVSQESSVRQALATTIELNGQPSVLVNNSGLQFMSSVEEFPLEKWNLIIGVLLTGTFLCSKTVVSGVRKQRFGRIVNIASIHGKLASPFKSAYVSAKHGVLGFAKVLAQEVASDGITVNTICPGFVDTPLMRGQVQEQMRLNKMNEQQVLEEVFLKQQSIKKLTSPEQIADLVMFLISPSSDTVTGEAFNVSGGWGMGL